MARVYLAGFDVFRHDAVQHGEYLKRLCSHYGMEGVYPLDNELPAWLSGQEAARWIAEQNLRLLSCADAVLANLNNFRGAEPDSGTVFETGVAQALGIPVWAYFVEQAPLCAQIPTDADGYCPEGYQVEDFGLPRNLMLACNWAGSSVTAEAAVAGLAHYLAAHTKCEDIIAAV